MRWSEGRSERGLDGRTDAHRRHAEPPWVPSGRVEAGWVRLRRGNRAARAATAGGATGAGRPGRPTPPTALELRAQPGSLVPDPLAHRRVGVVGVAPVQVGVEPAGRHDVVGAVGAVQHEVAQRLGVALDRDRPRRVGGRGAQLDVVAVAPRVDLGGLVSAEVVPECRGCRGSRRSAPRRAGAPSSARRSGGAPMERTRRTRRSDPGTTR